MREPRKVTVGCDCGLKLRVAIPESAKEGDPVHVKCQCGQRLRFRTPGRPKPTAGYGSGVEELLKQFRDYSTKGRT